MPEKEKQKNREKTICWTCARSCLGGCSWADEFIPVEGWDAEYWEKYESYSVNSCPMYLPDSKDTRCLNMNDKGAMLLMERALEVAHDDYVHCQRMHQEIENWIRKRGGKLCLFEDPEAVINKLKKDYADWQRYKANRAMIHGG